MIPTFDDIDLLEPTEQTGRTYIIDQTSKRIYGHTDGLDAVFQTFDKLLNTERFAHEIYNDQYGIELESLIGQSPDYVKSVLEYRVRDALMGDDRFIDLINFKINEIKDSNISFSATVICNHGSFNIGV